MNQIRRLWQGWLFLILILILVFAGCAGTKPQQVREEEMKKEPPLQTLAAQPEALPEKEKAAASRPEPRAFPPARDDRIRTETLPRLPVSAPRTERGIPRSAFAPGVPPAPAPKPVEAGKTSRFVLNFDNADIYEVIRVMAEMMKINYIIDPRVRGIVNIHTSGQISSEEVFPIFQALLKLNGATAVKRGLIHEIVPFGDAKKLYVPPVMTREAGKKMDGEKYVIQIIPLKYIAVSEVAKMVKPFLSDGADIVEQPSHNILILGDISSNVRKCLDLIDLFDVDIFADMRVRIYPVVNADVNEIAKEMERIFSSLEVSLKSGRGVGITFTPIGRINSLLVVSSIPGIFNKVEAWLKELDRVPGEGTQLSVFVYYVQNGKAKDLADVLKQIYTSARGAKVDFKEKVVTPAPVAAAPGPRGVRPAPTPVPVPSPPQSPSESGGVPEGEISIVVDETTNALIIRAYQRDYRAIMETIKKLDIYPKQVLIEVLLAEVTLTDAYRYGLEWSVFTDSFEKGGSQWNYSIGAGGTAQAAITSGLRYTLESAGRLMAAIHASASDNRLKVVSSPTLLASNNKEARIQIGSSQPILTNTYTTTGTATPGVVEGTIEYKDIGIILTVTPRISDGKLVTLDVAVESSTVAKTTLGNLAEVPYFGKKTAKTTLSIMEGQMIVIGGLIEDRKTQTTEGVPFLSKIPVLGGLFGYKTDQVDKTETVLFLTPHVITDLDESNRVTQEIRQKMFAIRKELERQKGETEKERKTEPQGKEQPTNPNEGARQNNPRPAAVSTNRDPWVSDIPP
jgi:general secretion pathway protein D